MSVHLLSACWKIADITSTQKFVLIALADQANDDGVCWPSVKTMQSRTCLSERAIQEAISALIARGMLVRHERSGRSSYFTLTPAAGAPPQQAHPAAGALHPRASCTPPPQQAHSPSAAGAPITVIEPSEEPQGNLQLAPHAPQGDAPGPKETSKTGPVWKAYSDAYMARYGAWPLWNQTVAGRITQFIKRVGEEAAPGVAAFYVTLNDAYYVRQQHAVGPLLANCEAIHTQWVTGKTVTSTKATQLDRSATNAANVADAVDIVRRMKGGQPHAQ